MSLDGSTEMRLKFDALSHTIEIKKLALEVKYGPSVKLLWSTKREKTNTEYDFEIPESAKTN